MWIYMYLIFFTEIYFLFPCNQLKKLQKYNNKLHVIYKPERICL